MQVVDALVLHFLRFADDERSMPVVWHQTLLCFVQRYRNEIKDEDKALLRRLISVQHHYQARRQPFNVCCPCMLDFEAILWAAVSKCSAAGGILP